ncbi:nitrogenase molybdenum-iron protein beta chain [Rhizomicrobium palustre]|uniref:Nitrogenase molybdenum-iron protein beta chain n=1 Tax=Rhizomicrobium palustre TaxID=189966 RepID=A0A846N229_9PROT|nr:nitrogenase molybdenum-iron protein subunit beta [Rhizomicrobium palustre]NIK89187.1 nitrogenase molybdenum-iron protein beta chain [Rhizomicrobium palustre]
MPQVADKIKDHARLFNEPEYQELFERKKAFECGASDEVVAKQSDYINSWEYREKNLARQALTVNPAKACQPLGAMFASVGFEKTLAFNHGSQGCTAYFRSHLARHFKEPCAAVSTSMTEDAAVFGGLNNLIDGLQNAYTVYKPKVIAVSTTCIAEVIGDDLTAFIQNARTKEAIPQDFPVVKANTPSFVGSHINGYDALIKGVFTCFWEGKERGEVTPRVNIIPGFDGYAVGNNRELKRIFAEFGIDAAIISDVSDQFDTPTDGKYRMFDGGTTYQQVEEAINASATISMQKYCTEKTLDFVKEKGQPVHAFHYPIGIKGTDDLLMTLSEITGKPIPESLEMERGRLVDAMADSSNWLHGKTYSIFGDPDFVYGMAQFIMELGGEPVHLLATNGGKEWEAEMKALLATSPYGAKGQVWPGKDLWAMRSLLATEPCDFLIGSSYGKYLEKDLGIPLIRLTFPIFDRHHHHRFPTWGYQGGLRVLVTILDKILDELDRETMKTGISFDLVR